MQETAATPAPSAAAAEAASASAPLAAWVGRIAGALFGIVLLVATVAKALDPQAFAERMQHQGLTFGLPPLVAAVLVLVVEGGLGLLLLLDVRRPWTLALATLLTATFVALNGWDWYQAAHGGVSPEGCGCFGNLVQRSPAAAFWQDLLLVPLLLLACLGLPRRAAALPPRRMAVVTVGVAALALLAWRAPALPLDDVATRLHPRTILASLCAGVDHPVCLPDVVPEVAGDRTWVVLVDIGDASHWAEALNAFAGREGSPPVVAVLDATPQQLAAFKWQWGPTFTLHEAPASLLRPLYRRLPRSFLSERGRVLRTVQGLPGDADVRGESTR